MKTFNSAKSGIFLIELIIAILFFSLGSAVCIQAFVKAHLISTQAHDLSFASAQVSGVASVMKYTDGTLESLQKYFGSAQAEGSGFEIYYNSDYEACGAKDAYYTICVSPSVTDGICHTLIQMTGHDGDTIYSLDIHYPLPKNNSKEAAA